MISVTSYPGIFENNQNSGLVQEFLVSETIAFFFLYKIFYHIPVHSRRPILDIYLLFRSLSFWCREDLDKQQVTSSKTFLHSHDLLFVRVFLLHFTFYCILLGRILQLPRGKGHKRTSRSYSKVPHLTHPLIRIRKTATAPGSPYSFRIVRGFFYVPQNYQHSRNCETGRPTYRPYPRRLESLTICR